MVLGGSWMLDYAQDLAALLEAGKGVIVYNGEDVRHGHAYNSVAACPPLYCGVVAVPLLMPTLLVTGCLWVPGLHLQLVWEPSMGSRHGVARSERV